MENEIDQSNHEMQQCLEARLLELEELNRNLSRFSQTVAHDLRAPLGHIRSFTGLICDAIGDHPDGELHSFVDQIEKAATLMDKLIGSYLALAELGYGMLATQKIDLNPLIPDVIGDLFRETSHRRIEWDIQDLPAVKAHPVLFRQVWFNLLSNALKYSRPREITRIKIGSLMGADGKPTFFVQDNGIGFDSEQANKLFRAFARLHDRREYEGCGLGLANVKRIIEAHGGATWAEGQPDAGATFFFSIAPGS